MFVTCEITEVQDDGLAVKVGDTEIPGYIRRAELSVERTERRPDRFAVGEKIDARIMTIDKSGRKASLSIKALEVEEEKKAMKLYGSADSGASLGDILGAALEKKKTGADEEAAPAKKKAAPKKAAASKAKKDEAPAEDAKEEAPKKKAAPKKAAAKAKKED